jgi:periplasmic divalent cation tolerance protein
MAPMRSIYIWNGKRETNAEVPVIMKTRRALAGEAVTVLRQAHPYDTPAILVLPVEGGAMPFLDWVRAQTAAPA